MSQGLIFVNRLSGSGIPTGVLVEGKVVGRWNLVQGQLQYAASGHVIEPLSRNSEAIAIGNHPGQVHPDTVRRI